MGFHDDYTFEVQIGRIRAANGTLKSKRFLKGIRKGARRLGSRNGVRASRNYQSQMQSRFHRRVIVKARVIRMDAGGTGAQRLHLKYIERDGTGPSGEPGKLYDRDGSQIDKDAFLERGKDDRHQFRFIVSPKDATELSDLTDYTRDLVAQMEHDLGTRLDWVAVNHYDTGQPHTHLVISGKRDDGTDLVIPRKYISHGIRARAQELAELELGPVTEIEGRNRLARMVLQERLTEIDRGLFRGAQDGVVDLSAPVKEGQSWRRQLGRMRLKQLSEMGLADPLGKGRWQIADDAETVLKRMGERGDIIKAMHRALQDNEKLRMMDASSIFTSSSPNAAPVTGKVIDKGIADDVNDKAYIVVDGLAGKPVYIEIGGEARLPEFASGQIVTVSPPTIAPRSSDHTIAKIAEANDGRYSTVLHMDADKSARPEFAQAHVRRLEALRRAGHATRLSYGTWRIPSNYLDRVVDYERAQATRRPPDISRQSKLTLRQMKTAFGATWLDEHMRSLSEANTIHGFGNEVDAAMTARRNFLTKQGFIQKDQMKLTDNDLAALRARDLFDAGGELSTQLGKAYRPMPGSGRLSGIYSHAIDRPSGRFAVIEKSREFSLVPWRDVMDRNLGKSISGIVRGNQISWALTKGRTIS